MCYFFHFKIEMKLLLARFFQKFEYTLDPDQDFGIQDNLTCFPRGGAILTLRQRKQKEA